jgi:hypothetical protein
MALIVGVHGIAQQGKGPPKLVDEWWPSLASGVVNAGRTIPERTLACAFYGGLFRGAEALRAAGEVNYVPADVTDPFESELLNLWWAEAALREPRRVVVPEAGTRDLPMTGCSRAPFFSPAPADDGTDCWVFVRTVVHAQHDQFMHIREESARHALRHRHDGIHRRHVRHAARVNRGLADARRKPVQRPCAPRGDNSVLAPPRVS